MLRTGYTLLELVVSLATGTFLVAGLTGALSVSSQALQPNSSQDTHRTQMILNDLARDVSLASRFTERTATALTFTVPDRDGDQLAETIRYAWSGTPGDPLTYEYNGLAAVDLATDVQAFDLQARTRQLLADASTANAEYVVLNGYSEAFLATDSNSITIATPPDTADGELLFAAVAVDGDAAVRDSLVTPPGWTKLVASPASESSPSVVLGVYWKIATASEPPSTTLSWTGNEQAYGWIMRFSGQSTTTPINAFSTNDSFGWGNATSPAVVSTEPNCLILRLMAVDGNGVTAGETGLIDHTSITMQTSNTTSQASASGGAGYAFQTPAGDSGPNYFSPTGWKKYCCVTIAIAPEATP